MFKGNVVLLFLEDQHFRELLLGLLELHHADHSLLILYQQVTVLVLLGLEQIGYVFRLLPLAIQQLLQLFPFAPLELTLRVHFSKSLLIGPQLHQQGLDPFLELVDPYLHAQQHLRILALIQVLLGLGVLDSVGRRLQLGRLVGKDLLGVAALHEAEPFPIPICVFRCGGDGEAVGAVEGVGLFLLTRRLFLGKIAFRIARPHIISFGLLGLPGAAAKLQLHLQRSRQSATGSQPHLLPTVLRNACLSAGDLNPTGFLPDRCHYNATLHGEGCTCGVASSMAFSVRRNSRVPKSTRPSEGERKEVAAERSLAA